MTSTKMVRVTDDSCKDVQGAQSQPVTKKTVTFVESPARSSFANTMLSQIMESYIKPLIHGCAVHGPFSDGVNSQDIVEQVTPNKLIVRPCRNKTEYCILERPIAFDSSERTFLERVAHNIATYSLETYHASPFLIGAAIEQAIAWSISPEYPDAVYQVLQVYAQWASETHEGKRLAHTVGIYFNRGHEDACTLYEARHCTSLKNLGSNDDTLLAVGNDGSILGMELVSSKLNNYKKDRDIFAPINNADVAMWTNSRQKAAISLTKHGDLLVFKEKQLVFAKRRSYWRSFPHPLIMRETIPMSLDEDERKSRKAVYLTALDIAMTRRGGCLGVFPVSSSLVAELKEIIRPESLFCSSAPSREAQFLSNVVCSRKFFEIPRKLRADLCSIDGALIIDSTGTILTAGAIVKTEGNLAMGGGRSAAARTLARNGFGIKISSDGYIEIHDGNNPPVYFA